MLAEGAEHWVQGKRPELIELLLTSGNVEPIAYLRENPQAKQCTNFPNSLRINETKFGNLSQLAILFPGFLAF